MLPFTWYENDLLVPCPCGQTAIAKFVLPTTDKHLVVVAVCETCHRKGANPTTFGYIEIDFESWKSLVESPSTVLIRRQK